MTIHKSIKDDELGKFVDVDETGPAVRVVVHETLTEAQYRKQSLNTLCEIVKLLNVIANHQRLITGVNDKEIKEL
jgi:hypothetical protein